MVAGSSLSASHAYSSGTVSPRNERSLATWPSVGGIAGGWGGGGGGGGGRESREAQGRGRRPASRGRAAAHGGAAGFGKQTRLGYAEARRRSDPRPRPARRDVGSRRRRPDRRGRH